MLEVPIARILPFSITTIFIAIYAPSQMIQMTCWDNFFNCFLDAAKNIEINTAV